MQIYDGKIYQKPRVKRGYTQEHASELLFISVESLRAYETGKTTPPNDVVCKMVAVYDAQYLAYQHLMYSSEVARQCLPDIDIRDLPSAILHLQKEVKDFIDCRDELVEITYDGVISEDERPRFDAILCELDDIVQSIMSLKYANTKGADGGY